MKANTTIVDQVRRKLLKGFNLVQRYSYGLPYWRFEKGKTVSNYPRINEDTFCYLKYDKRLITEFKTIRDNVRFHRLTNSLQ